MTKIAFNLNVLSIVKCKVAVSLVAFQFVAFLSETLPLSLIDYIDAFKGFVHFCRHIGKLIFLSTHWEKSRITKYKRLQIPSRCLL